MANAARSVAAGEATGVDVGEAADAGEDGGIDPNAVAGPDRADPLGWLARAAGQSDGEQWWDRTVESRRESAGAVPGDPGSDDRTPR